MKKLFSALVIFFFFSVLHLHAQVMPTVTAYASNTTVFCGNFVQFIWSGTNAKYCMVTSSDGSWNAQLNVSGATYIGPLRQTVTYVITAVGDSGYTASCSVTIKVTYGYASIPGRAVGAGTFITAPLQAFLLNIPENTGDKKISGFEISVANGPLVYPQYFSLDNMLQQYGWQLSKPFFGNDSMKYATAGYPAYFFLHDQNSNFNLDLGNVGIYVYSDTSGPAYLHFSFYNGDEKVYWGTNTAVFEIINIPFLVYGDLNRDGVTNVSDGILYPPLLGKVLANDTLMVIADLDGDGIITSRDFQLSLDASANPDARWNWPIFSGNQGYGYGNTIPVAWQQMSDGNFGLFTVNEDTVTNGDITVNNPEYIVKNNSLVEKGNKLFFAGKNIIGNPIIISKEKTDIGGMLNNHGKIVLVNSSVTKVDKPVTNPSEFLLSQNYPNPFNPSTTIDYQIPKASNVTIKVYDLLGKEVATLVNEEKAAGTYTVNFNADNLSSGLYIYQIKSGNFIQTKKMTLLK